MLAKFRFLYRLEQKLLNAQNDAGLIHRAYDMQLRASAAIAGYAEQNGFEIVTTYADGGRSGVILKQRTGLQRLLADVVSGTPTSL